MPSQLPQGGSGLPSTAEVTLWRAWAAGAAVDLVLNGPDGCEGVGDSRPLLT